MTILIEKEHFYRKSSHCTYDIKYHIIWITKNRKPVLMGKIAMRTRELIRKICQTNDVEILAGYVGKDHIHLLVSVPPHLSAASPNPPSLAGGGLDVIDILYLV